MSSHDSGTHSTYQSLCLAEVSPLEGQEAHKEHELHIGYRPVYYSSHYKRRRKHPWKEATERLVLWLIDFQAIKDHFGPLTRSPVWKVRGFSQRLPGLCWRWWAVCGDNHLPKHCQSPDQCLSLARAKFHSLQTFHFPFGILLISSEVLTEKRLHVDLNQNLEQAAIFLKAFPSAS